ncbi:hypothetical protein N4G70_34285 [Streptomyces sp. ASQP_92]|uniref:hypothetical protein n=1 Tax=Streptomyces sp. ASQP_92 TaxID=2979116 RepID=UPI0021C01D53|nr:hypothetical protein [Streptomyces sp. ASQP_92]MCT9093888.1 hypothetical protein [Streptomyces sp. ASQP_92]
MNQIATRDGFPQRTFTAEDDYTGPVLADVTCPTGTVYATVDPAATVATVRVLTHDAPDSAAAKAVRNTRISQSAERLVVVVPDVPAAAQQFGGMNFVGGVTVINGVRYNGNVSVVNGRVIGGTAQHVSTGVEVHITLPAGSGIRSRSENGSLRASGVVAAIEAEATNGSITAECVGRIKAEAGNGSVKVGRVTEWIDAEASNGSVKVEEYAGSACRVRAGNGSVNFTVAPAASGRIDVKAGNGSVKLYGVRGRTDLDVNASAGNGTVKKF